MKKLKLLFAICALMVGGVSVVQAQTDVTSTYLTNPGFDGDFQRFFDINTDRGVEKPRGWSVEWYQDNNDKNGMTYNATSMTQDSKTWNAKSNKAYFARMRWGNAILYLRQTLQNLRPGDYTLSFSATAHSTNNNNSVKVSVAGETQTIASGSVSNENGNWTDYSINFTVTESTPYATIEFKAERKGDLLKIGIDEFKLMYDGSSYYNTILTKAQALYDDNKDWAEKGLSDFNSAITTNSGKSTVADKNEAIVAIENAMATFKADNSVDMTSRINNPNFDSNISGWTTTGGDGNAYGRQTSSQTNFTGGFLEKWRNSWNGSHNQANFDVYQALTNLPNGEYTVKAYILAQMQGSKETLDKDYKDKKHGGPYYIDNEKGVWFYATSGNNTNNVWANSFTPSFGDTSGGVLRSATVQVADGNLTIGFKGIGSQNGGNSLGTYANWIACDTWTLSYFGFDPSTLKAQISDLKNDVQDIIDGDEVPTALKTSLQGTLNNLVETPETKSVLDAAISTLQNAINNANSIKVAYAKVNAHIDFVTSEKTNSTGTKTTIEAAINTANTNKENCTTAEALEEVYNTLETARQTYVTGGAQPTADHVFDFTFKISDATVTGSGNWSNKNTASGQQYTDAPDNKYMDCGWNTTYQSYQTVADLPAGYYTLKAATRANSSDITAANVYVNQDRSELNRSTDNHKDGNTGGTLGNGWSWTEVNFELRATGDVSVGFYGQTTGQGWAGADDFHLYYKGNAVDDETAEALKATVVSGKMNSTVSDNQSSALSAFETAQTIENYEALEVAIAAAKTSAENYAKVKAAIDETAETVATLDDAGQAAYNNNISSVQSAYDNGTITNEDYEAKIAVVKAALIAAVKAQTTVGSDWTLLITNPSFESDFSGWTNTEMATQSNGSFTLKEGSKYVEKWEPNGTFSVSQTIKAMPTGVYRISAAAFARDVTSAKIQAGGMETAVTIGGDAANYSVEFACDDNADITIGFEGVGTGAGASWLCVDNFTMTLVSAGLPDVVAVDGKMNADVAQAQTEAIATYNNDKTVANYNAASEAIKAAQASKDAYTAAATYIAKAKDVKTNQNFASATAITTFAEAIAAIETPYNNNTLTTEAAAAAGTTLGVAVTGWRANPNGAAVQYMNDGFSITGYVDNSLYVNTWSTEGSTDGSDFTVPFYEYWNSDANSLAQRTWTGTLTDLPNGQYKISTWVRVRAKNETAAADATGITIAVNDGDAVDVTEGTQIGEGQFQIATYEALGLVKDGTLNFNVNIAEDKNISWLAFKNVKYTKVRDLTPDEAAVKPTAIALDPTTVTLNATTNTATLTPTFTPQDATQTVTWTSSDEGVATVNNGVVTGVAPGTATITVTSTLDENVKATATVTVSYPETVYETSSYTNDGATRTIYALGENIIKNGSFEYPNGYYGWKNGAGGDLAAANFDIVTEEDNKYLKAKNSEGAGSANSISTAWPIEAGKTYVFGYKVKASTTVGDKSKYLVVSMTNTPGTETKKVSKDDETVNTEWNSIKYEFTNTEGYAYVQFRARWLANSLSFDDFYLAEATHSIVGNVDYATAAIPTANIGTGAFQYSQDAIDAANALVQGTATVADVENAYNAVTTLNSPEETQAYNIVLNCEGHNYTGNALTLVPNPNQAQGYYGLKYLAPANVNLAQAFYFVHTTGNKYKVYAVDTDGNDRYITTQAEGYGTTWYEGIRTITDASKAMEIEIRPNGEGLYLLWNTGANKALAHNGNTNNDLFTNNTANFQFVETSKPSITINTTAAGWGTTILPFAVTSLPEGVKVYTISESNGNALTLEEHNAIDANKPYVIEGAWSETLTGDALGTALKNTEGLLVGTYTRIPAPNGSYILQKQGDKVGFFKVDTTVAEPNVPANRAYLSEEASSVRGFLLDDSEVITAINAVKALTEGEALIYDMNGVQQPRLKKGMNIIRTKDGRTQKVMVR